MATELAQAYVQIIPSARGMSGRLSGMLGGEAGRAGNAAGGLLGGALVSKMLKLVAAAQIGKKIVEGISASMREGAALEQSIGGIETLFKESSDIVIANAKKAFETAGMSANEYMENVTSFSASLLQGLGGDTAKAAEIADMAMVDMSDNANKMGTSMENIQNAYQGFAKQNYTMLDNLKLGYGGTKKEMERLLADARDITGIKYDIDNLSDVYSAIHVIQEELDITGTTAQEAATTFSGSFSAMKASWSNLLGYIATGEDLSQPIKDLVSTASTFFFGNFIPMLGNIVSALPGAVVTLVTEAGPILVEKGGGMISSLIQGIQNNLPQMISTSLSAIDTLTNTITANLPGVLEKGKEIIKNLANGIYGNAPAFLNAVVTLVTEAGPILVEKGGGMISSLIQGIQNNLPQMISTGLSAIDTVTNTITANLPGVLEKGKEIIKNLADGLYGNTPTFLDMVGDIISKMISFIGKNLPVILDAGADMLLSIVKGFVNNLPQIVSSTVSMVTKITTTIIKYLPDIIQKGYEIVAKLIAGLIKAIPDLVAAVPKIIDAIAKTLSQVDWATLGNNIIKGIANGMINGIALIVDAAKQAAESAFNTIKDKLDIHSPSRVFETQVGRMIDLGLAAGIDNNIQEVRNSMKNLSMETVGYIKPEINSVAGKYFEYEPQVNEIDYEKMADAFAKAGVSVELDGRIVGRMLRRYF